MITAQTQLVEMITQATSDKDDRYSWADWKEIFRTSDIGIIADDTGNPESIMLSSADARSALMENCTYEHRTFTSEPVADVKERTAEELAAAEAKLAANGHQIVETAPPGAITVQELANKVGKTVSIVFPARDEYFTRVTASPVGFPTGATQVQNIEGDKQGRVKGIGASPKIIKSVAPEVSRQLSIEDWRQGYRELQDRLPFGQFIETIDGSPIKINIEFPVGQPPVMLTRISIPNVVCGRLGWFAQREEDEGVTGWTVIVTEKARNEAMQRFDITQPYGLVETIRIIRMTHTRRSLICDIVRWL